MNEPTLLRNFTHKRVKNLSEGLKQLFSGDALCYSFDQPSSLFIGSIPFQAQAVWHKTKEVSLHVSSGGCTYFLWNHQVENLVFTGLLVHQFRIYNFDIYIIFHVFDAIKLCTSIKIDALRNLMEEKLLEGFKDHQYDSLESKEFICFLAEFFFKYSKYFDKYGVSINEIVPRVHLNFKPED